MGGLRESPVYDRPDGQYWPPEPGYPYRRPWIYRELRPIYQGPDYGPDEPGPPEVRRPWPRVGPPRIGELPPRHAHRHKSVPLPSIAEPRVEPFHRRHPTRVAAPPAGPAKPTTTSRPGPTPAPLPVAAYQSVLPDEVLFELRGRASPAILAAIARQYGLASMRADRLDLLDTTIYRMRITDRRRRVDDVVRALRADARIASVQGNSKFRLQEDQATNAPAAGATAGAAPPAAPAGAATAPAIPAATAPAGAGAASSATLDAAGLQWAADKMQLPAIHRITQGRDVVVAIVDSGIDAAHPELAGSQVDLVNVADTPFKPHGHGTAMAGAIMAHAKLLGVAPQVRIIEIRAFDGETVAAGAEGTTDHILRGLDTAYKSKATIVNLSFAGPPDALLSRMLAALRQKGIVVIAAAGNGGPTSPPLFPAADPNVIAVTATDADDGLYKDANRGDYIHLAAPGVDVLEPAPGGAYQLTSGTSVAAALVSGVAALLEARDAKLGPDELQKMLTATATKRQTAQPSDALGPGLVDAYRALQALDGKPAQDQAPSAAVNH